MIQATLTRARHAAAALTVVAAVLARAGTAAACSCMPLPEPKEALAKADAVFVGSVQRVGAADADGAPDSRIAVTFSVLRSWKGVEEPSVTVSTSVNTAVCGYPFEAGRRYLVYATRVAPVGLTTNLCTRTAEEDAASYDLSELGQGRPSPGGH